MNVTPEELAAFGDGELDVARAAQVEAAISANPELAAQVEAHRKLKTRLAAHFAPILTEPLPARLIAPLALNGDVVDLAAARARRETRRGLPRWTWLAGPALAASLVLALFAPQGDGRDDYASPEIAGVLDNQLVSSQPARAATRILLSFRDEEGVYCRAFAGIRESGIACREAAGWRLRIRRDGKSVSPREYRQAGSHVAGILAVAQDMAVGPALDTQEEIAAKARDWR